MPTLPTIPNPSGELNSTPPVDFPADRILIVDDEELNRDMLQRRLIRNGLAVDCAEDGFQALAMIGQSDYDLVLLDVMMPGMNGFEVLTKIRETHSSSDLPVIIATACDQSSEVVEALESGANDYITKPLNFAISLARIRTQLGQRRAAKALQRSQERYMLAARGANDGLWDWDLTTGQIFLSGRWRSILGDAEDAQDTSPEQWFSRIHAEDRARVEAEIADHREGRTPYFESEHRLRHSSGAYRWVLARGALVCDPQGKPCRMAGSLTDLTASKVSDALTGLPNRLLFNEKLDWVLEKAKSSPNYLFGLLFIDVDRFKLVNDSLGHAIGDELIIGIAQRLRDVVRNSDLVARDNTMAARFGGDEFAVLLERIGTHADAQKVAERVLEAFKQPFNLSGREVFATVSIGIAVGSMHYRNAGELLRDADTAMYRAKALGKSRAELFDKGMHETVVAHLQLENDLRRALERDQFFLVYQPIQAVQTGKLMGFEALVRWNHPDRGTVSPALFIPLAEETGLIAKLGEWVLEKACHQLMLWQAEYPSDPPLFMGINVSTRQLKSETFHDLVQKVLSERKLPPSSVRLEITESALIEDSDTVIKALEALKAIGVGLQIDDFGTGYSSLSYVDKFPIDTIKIDRSFVTDIDSNAEHKGIVQAILALAESLGLRVTAEGVETRKEYDELRGMDCRMAQGYFIAKPLLPNLAEKMLADNRQCVETGPPAAS